MKNVNYKLTSCNSDDCIGAFIKFDARAIKAVIINHLKSNPTDQIEFSKKNNDSVNFVGDQIIDFYAINPKNNKPSLLIMKGSKEYFKALK